MMPVNFFAPEFEVVRDNARCTVCRICERQCANSVHAFEPETGRMTADNARCVACHRCVALCPAGALKIVKSDHTFFLTRQPSPTLISEALNETKPDIIFAVPSHHIFLK